MPPLRVESDVVRIRAILDCRRHPSWIRKRSATVIGFGSIKQFGQLCSWSFILNDVIPFRIAAEFRKDTGQIAEQLTSLVGRKGLNRLLDLLGGAHAQTN
jgi:hypothetical protein